LIGVTVNIGAIVLADHKSELIGKQKQLIRLNGKTLIEIILDSLTDAGINDQVIVLGDDMAEVIEAIPPKLGKIKIAINIALEKGMASSVQTGIIVLSNIDAILIVLANQPILDSELLKKMVATMENNPETLIVSPIYEGKKGHPLLFRKSLLGELMSLKDNHPISDIISDHFDKLVTVEAPEWSTLNIDTPEDYARILNIYKSK
jgi:molybdenum cofactor cytidylyltransferase